MSDITVNSDVKNGWLNVIRDKIDAKPSTTWATAPARIAVGSTVRPTDTGTYPYIFKASSSVSSVSSLVVASGVATLVSTAHGLLVGEIITVSGTTPSQLNASWSVATVVDANTIEFNVMDLADVTATGTITFKRNIGAKGGSEPTWPATLGNTVTDGKLIWTNIGGMKGKIRIYSGNRPAQGVLITNQTLLAELFFSDPSAPDASSSALTFSAITPDSSANASGTATWARILDCSDNPIYDCSVSLLAGSGDIKMSSLQITATGVVSISAATIVVE